MYISEKCNWTPYGTNPELDKKVDSDDWKVREAVAWQRYGLDRLINDKNALVLQVVAKQGYGLDKLVTNKNRGVRYEVVKHGYGLDKLVNDEWWEIRQEVAIHGYGFDKLVVDKNWYVSQSVRMSLKENNLSIYQWIEQNPDKCVNNASKLLNLLKVIKNFIYKIDESTKLEVQTQYDSIDEFFEDTLSYEKNTLVIYTVDTKIPLFKIEKIENDKIEYKYIVDITDEQCDDFRVRTVIKSKAQLNRLIQQTIDALESYPQFSKYIDDLENCL